jgi:hypothetical protein
MPSAGETYLWRARKLIKKKLLRADRVRKITGGFSFIPHRFLTEGFLSALSQKELLLYFFLVLVSDRDGLSFYAYDVICSLLEMSLDEYIEARDGLIKKDLIAFDGTLFQVLDLPQHPVKGLPKEVVSRTGLGEDRTGIAALIRQSLGEGRR